MKNSWQTPARTYAPGIGDAVADRTINRLLHDGSREKWSDVAFRVATGNASLTPKGGDAQDEFEAMHHHLRQASLLLSGRHLQHGDETQASRNQEVFTNCSTSAASLIGFYLLLNGSGVGRSYDDDMMVVDWAGKMPRVAPVISGKHPDVLSGEIPQSMVLENNAVPMDAATTFIYRVPDSREGWAKAIEQIERMTFEGEYSDATLVLDFSDVRHRGQPIGGMQNRPASGPGPLMEAIAKIAALRGTGMEPWESTMHVDHYLAECVLVGGARRAARMATKTWRDRSVLGFISIKRGGKLWSSNNSVTVDAEFWAAVSKSEPETELEAHAKIVFESACRASYFDETGEPGFINVDRLTQKNEGVEVLFEGDFARSKRFVLDEPTLKLTAAAARAFASKSFTQITNPCGEISLAMVGGYCVIADVVPFLAGSRDADLLGPRKPAAEWDDDAEDAFRTAVRALIRTNTMDCLYRKEVERTNRIGVGITGLHEYAWTRFGYGWKDLVNEKKSIKFWRMLARFSRACVDEARSYSEKLGVAMPHTVTTMKPAGCATPDSTVKTTEGVLSLEQVFARSGYTLDALKGMDDGTWLEPKVQTLVLDENNDEKEVTKLYVNGIKPVYEIEFEDGHTVKLTGNHKLKTTAGWKRVDELTEEDEVLSY